LRDFLINLVIIRTTLSKQRNINLVVLEKLAFFRSAIFVEKYSAVESIELCIFSDDRADRVQLQGQLYRLQGMTYEKDSSD